jgi:hypothetical protein
MPLKLAGISPAIPVNKMVLLETAALADAYDQTRV